MKNIGLESERLPLARRIGVCLEDGGRGAGGGGIDKVFHPISPIAQRFLINLGWLDRISLLRRRRLTEGGSDPWRFPPSPVRLFP